MLTVLGRPRRACNDITRRQLLQVGGAGLFGLSFPGVLAAEAAQPARAARARSVLFVFLCAELAGAVRRLGGAPVV